MEGGVKGFRLEIMVLLAQDGESAIVRPCFVVLR